ncbi:MAG: hypothetical protein NVS3B28_28300 [Candidatus Velthaea sp.]
MTTTAHGQTFREAHFALTIEPSVLRYRARNAAATPSPKARVRFLVPAELLPLAGADDECELPALEPGQTYTLDYPVTVRSPLPNDSRIDVQALLLVDGREPLGTNVAHGVVRSRARLDGPGTIVTLAPAEQPDRVLVGATVANDGDAAALNAVLHLPPPLGARAADIDQRFTLGRIEPGETITISYEAHVVDPLSPMLVAADATITHDDGSPAALRPSAPLALAATCTPRLVLESEGRRTRMELHIANDGWCDAGDVHVALFWPAEYRAAEGSLTIDGCAATRPKTRGALCRAQHRADGAAIVLRRIARRTASVVAIDLYAGSKAAGGDVRAVVTSAGSAFERAAPIAASPDGAFALRLLEGPEAPVDAGEIAHLRFELTHAGDRTQTCTLALEGDAVAVTVAGRRQQIGDPIPVAPGAASLISIDFTVPFDAADGAHVTLGASAISAQGARVCAVTRVQARNRVWIDSSDWLSEDAGIPHVRLRNRGSSIARGLAIIFAGGDTQAIADIEPFATISFPVAGRSPAAVARGCIVTRAGVEIAQLGAVEIATAAFSGEVVFTVPADASAGVALSVRMRIRVPARIETLHVRARADAHVVALPGSTSINGHAVIDAHAEALLYTTGLKLHGVPSESFVEIGWSVLPHAGLADGTTLAIHVDLDADGSTFTADAPPVSITAQQPFAARPESLPFHLDAPVAGARDASSMQSREPAAAEAQICAAPPRFTLELDDERCETIARLLRGAIMPGLISHVFSLRALFSDGVTSDDPSVHEALALERDALRALLDRLYVKMRIPGYDLIASDCEDITARRSILALLGAIGDDRATAELENVPLGAPPALAVVARFLPETSAVTELGSRIADYIAEIRRAFDDARTLALGDFEERLANDFDVELDRARARVLELLADRVPAYA